MKNKFQSIVKSIFSVSVLLSLFGGGLIFLIFILALLLGGARGEELALLASKSLMPYFIRAASLGVFSGLASLYLGGKRLLSL